MVMPMTPERFQQVGEVYDQAMELAPDRREAFLRTACADDEELRREVESLLTAHETAEDFMDQPAVAIVADLVTKQTSTSLAGEKIGNYQVLSLLGKGGMGEVYLAKDLKLGREVALKILPRQFAQDRMRMRMFEREARAASALNHPNILTIFELGEFEGSHFIVSEYIEGQTVRARLQTSPLPLREALDVAVQTASALAVAHQVGIVHRDIKPENVMVRRDGYVKVLDFGLAKLTEPAVTTQLDLEAITQRVSSTVPGTVMGTVSYMSPEQARGEAVDGRSDIFSLGVLLYEMATGKTPFTGATAIEMLAAILEREPAPLMGGKQQLPSELERIVTKALRKDRGQRYQRIQDLLLDLENLQQQITLGAAAAPLSPVLGKRFLLGAVAVLVLLIATLVTISSLRSSPPAVPPNITVAPEHTVNLERTLTYSLIAQRDPKRFPDSTSFPSIGAHIFGAGDRARLLLSSEQAGYLYVLNEGPPDQISHLANYVVLFPDADVTDGSAALSAGRAVQIPPSGKTVNDNWIEFDKEKGTEKFWLVWSERSVPELEAVKHLANPKDMGAITNPDQIVSIAQYLSRHSAPAPELVKDEEQKKITFKTKGEVLVALLRIEHQ